MIVEIPDAMLKSLNDLCVMRYKYMVDSGFHRAADCWCPDHSSTWITDDDGITRHRGLGSWQDEVTSTMIDVLEQGLRKG